MNPYDHCLKCGYDLDGHAFKQAVAEAEARDGPDPPPNRVIFYWWPKTLNGCPRCGAIKGQAEIDVSGPKVTDERTSTRGDIDGQELQRLVINAEQHPSAWLEG